MNDIVLKRAEGPVLILTLNDPDRANPLSAKMASVLSGILDDAEGDQTIRAVVLTGAGRHFSAGADLSALERIAGGGSADANLEDSRVLETLFARVLSLPKLTVAAVRGAAIAGGCGLATACDFVVAEKGSTFCYTEVKIGFIPALVSTFLTRRVPGNIARRMLLDPEMLNAEQAHDLGLVDELADDGLCVDRAAELALSICRKASPSALAATKALMNRTVGMDWRDALAIAAEANAGQRADPECRLGVSTFLRSKRTPDWLDGTS